jgi:hypothetical protein
MTESLFDGSEYLQGAIARRSPSTIRAGIEIRLEFIQIRHRCHQVFNLLIGLGREQLERQTFAVGTEKIT